MEGRRRAGVAEDENFAPDRRPLPPFGVAFCGSLAPNLRQDMLVHRRISKRIGRPFSYDILLGNQQPGITGRELIEPPAQPSFFDQHDALAKTPMTAEPSLESSVDEQPKLETFVAHELTIKQPLCRRT